MSVITVSRQTASLADEITRRLCERLDYHYFDKALMAQLAPDVGLAPHEVVDVSEREHRAPSLLERFFGRVQTFDGDPAGFTYTTQADAHVEMTVQQVRALIMAAYNEGNVVIAGRGSQVVLADRPDVLHVRIAAPAELRARRWQERLGLSIEAARERVRVRDAAHVDFVRRFFDVDLTDPSLYDLTVNTGKPTPVAAVEVIVKAVELLPARAS